MVEAYKHIATLLCKHRYFRENVFRSIDVSYDEETARLVKDIDIVIKPFSGGIHLLSSNPELLHTINETHPLRLYLSCKDPFYINYTKLPVYNLRNKIVYFNNLRVYADADHDGFRLHKEAFIGELDVVELNQGKVNIPSYDPNKKYVFTDGLGNEMSDQYVKQSGNEPNEFILSGLSQGPVHLMDETEEIQKSYYNPNTVWKKPIGIIEIHTAQLFEQYKESGKLEYILSFNSRKTIWKYFLVSPVYQKFNNLSIINKEKEQVFNPPSKQQIMENTEVLMFESKSKLPLSEFSNDNFQLVNNYDPDLRSGKVIIKNLIRASPEQLYRDETISNEPMYSHMYL